MAVFENGKVLPGTERGRASEKTVLRRRASRRAWKLKAKAKPGDGKYCSIYGWRKAGR